MRDFPQTLDLPVSGALDDVAPARPCRVDPALGTAAPAPGTTPAEPASAEPQVQLLAVPDRSDVPLAAGAPLGINLALFGSIVVEAQVSLGQVELDLGRLMRMREGDVFQTGRLVNQPVDVLVRGNVVARGELVAVDEYFGVRITQVTTIGTV
jgi:flagellar motor switch protein FliN/FliY